MWQRGLPAWAGGQRTRRSKPTPIERHFSPKHPGPVRVLLHNSVWLSHLRLTAQEIEPDAALRTAALQTSPNFQPDGRFQVSIDVSAHELPKDHGTPINEPAIDLTDFVNAPPMNVNIMIVGSRGSSY